MLPLRRLAGGDTSRTLPRGVIGTAKSTSRHREGPPGRSGRALGYRCGVAAELAGGSGHLAGLAARGQLVAGVVGRGLVVGALARQLRELALDLAPDPTDGDAEDALPALDEVDDLVGRRALVDRGAVAHQGDLGEVLDAALTQVCDGDADLLERDAGVEEALDDLEHEDVAEPVEALRARARGAADRRLDEPRAGPVVELAVGDAGGTARGGPAVADVVGEVGQVVGEEQTLGAAGHRAARFGRVLHGGHAVLLRAGLRDVRRRHRDNYTHVVIRR